MKDFVQELTWRGMIHQMMPGTDELLRKEQVTAYLGIDPTADSLHIGHLCGVMMLRHFQRCGHKPLALVGGATGMIGDPSGKSQERNLLDEETLRHNVQEIDSQMVVMAKELETYSGEYVGITKFTPQDVEILLSEVEEMVFDNLYDQWYENALVQLSLTERYSFKTKDVCDHDWSEIDSVSNLLKIRQIIKYEK